MRATSLHYDPTSTYDVRSEDVEYRRDGERSWMARVYQPRGQGPFPAVLEVHGGAWSGGDRLQNAPVDERLAASGLVVVAIDFHSSSEAPYPASMIDINYATRWLKAHATNFSADGEHIGGAGFSSGGHLLMLSAMRPRDPRYATVELPEAPDLDASLAYVIMGWPVIDPYSRYLFAKERDRENLVQAAFAYFGDETGMQEANPQLILERGEPVELPPALLVQGSADEALTAFMAERFVEAYSGAGGVIEIGKYPGAPHGFAREDDANSRRAIELMKSFIARQLAERALAESL